MGFEPTQQLSVGLESTPLDRSGICASYKRHHTLLYKHLFVVDRTFYTFPPRTFFTFSRTLIIPDSPYSKDIPTPVHHHPIISKSNRHVPYTTNKKRHVRIQIAEQSRLFLSLSRIIIRLFRIRSYQFIISFSPIRHNRPPTRPNATNRNPLQNLPQTPPYRDSQEWPHRRRTYRSQYRHLDVRQPGAVH